MSFSEPGQRLNIQMELVQEGGRLFRASLTGSRLAMTPANLVRMAARFPLMTLRVTALIHLHGRGAVPPRGAPGAPPQAPVAGGVG